MQRVPARVRDRSPFCPAYAHYTETLSRFVYGLSRVMTLSDVAELTLLNWDTVKAIAKTHLAKDYGKPLLKGVRYPVSYTHLVTKSTNSLHYSASNRCKFVESKC